MKNGDQIHNKAEGFDDDDELEAAADAQHERLKQMMTQHLEIVQRELKDGTLHGLVIVRVNDEHKVASCMAICNDAAHAVGFKLQEISMDLVLPSHERDKLKGIMSLLRRASEG